MEVVFRTSKLEKEYRSHDQARKSYGPKVARRYIQRVTIIRKMRNIEELMRLPGLRCHALKGDRKGQYAMKLTGFYRLIISLEGKSFGTVQIEEVSKHYGD